MTESATLDALTALACAQGGFAYLPEQPAHLEPTCLALLALVPHRDRYAELITSSLAFLEHCRLSDGTYRLDRGRPEAAWPTALALFTLAELDAPAEKIDGTARALLALQGKPAETCGADNINDIDCSLIGWSWAQGTFSWVEPTSWACLALRRVGLGNHERVRMGFKLLLDRVLATGGVNYGNRRIFGITLEPIPTPTSIMLLAMQGLPDEELVQRCVEYLKQHALTSDDVEHLAWATLALDAHRDKGITDEILQTLRGRLVDAVEQRAATPYLRQAPLRLALFLLALQSARSNPFRLKQASADRSLTPSVLHQEKKPIAQRVRSYFQTLALKGLTQLKPLEPTSQVHVAPASDYNADLVGILSEQFNHFREKVPLKNKRVVLKPNLVEYHRDKVINTHPNVVAAVIELCLREGASEVIVAEGPGHWRNVEHLVKASGLGDVLRHYKTHFVDLNHDEPIKTVNLSRLTRLEHLYLSKTVTEAEVLISLPKLKTHHWAVATLSLKNLFGTMPGICYGWPKNELHWRGIENSIVDIAVTRTPDLAIVDGIVGMEGDGPLNGTPRHAGLLIMGTDLVAVDATCCRLMQLDASKVGYLILGHQMKLGNLIEGRIEQLGETIEQRKQPFDTIPQFKPLWLGRSA